MLKDAFGITNNGKYTRRAGLRANFNRKLIKNERKDKLQISDAARLAGYAKL